jgi:signal-transduction protein with cAMP-binding, CBS, and nucleotidyltransferase domain
MDEVLNYMSEPVACLEGTASAVDAAKTMAERRISSVLVRVDGVYAGIVTRTDLVSRVLARGLDAAATPLTEVMSSPLHSMDHYLTAGDAHEYMVRHKVKHLAITREGRVVGLVTRKDLVG